MAFTDLFNFSGIFDRIKAFLGPFGKLLDSLKQSYDKLIHIFDAATKLKDSVVAEVDGWRNFKQDIRFAQRVVQLESAFKKTRDLIQGIPAAWRSIVDVFKQSKDLLPTTANPIAEEEAIFQDAEQGGFKSLLEKFPRLARGLEKALGALAILLQALETIASVIDDLQTIVDEISGLRKEFEKLDTIFLPQSNKRKTLKLASGKSIRIRVGHLHASA